MIFSMIGIDSISFIYINNEIENRATKSMITSLILLSIWHSQKKPDKFASLHDIISMSDYLNHVILSLDEINTGTNKLIFLDLINYNDNLFQTANSFDAWFLNQKFNTERPNYNKEWKAIDDFLKQLEILKQFDGGIEIQPDDKMIIAENVYLLAKNQYLKHIE
jgi:hypothetical protein